MTIISLPRHGSLAEFLSLTDGFTIEKIAEVLRCCTRSVRNWIKGRSPIPWHRLECLRLWTASISTGADGVVLPENSALAEVVTEEQEQLAWVAVHAPHFLSRRHTFDYYVRGWRVIDKIQQAKASGSFREILRRWRSEARQRFRQWRSGPLFADADEDFPPLAPITLKSQ